MLLHFKERGLWNDTGLARLLDALLVNPVTFGQFLQFDMACSRSAVPADESCSLCSQCHLPSGVSVHALLSNMDHFTKLAREVRQSKVIIPWR